MRQLTNNPNLEQVNVVLNFILSLLNYDFFFLLKNVSYK